MKQSSWSLFPAQPVFAVCSRWSTGLQTQIPGGWHLCQGTGIAALGGHALPGQPFQKLAAGFVIYLLLATFCISVQQATAQGTVTCCKSGVWFLLEQTAVPNAHEICLENISCQGQIFWMCCAIILSFLYLVILPKVLSNQSLCTWNPSRPDKSTQSTPKGYLCIGTTVHMNVTFLVSEFCLYK